MRTFDRRLITLMILPIVLILGACQPVVVTPPEPSPQPAAETVTATPAAEEPEVSAEPIKVGSTLPLTGVFAPTGGQIHPVVGEIFLERLNESGGLLGRPVEWVTLDDGSSPEKAAELYEQLISEEGVDLIIGPHGSASIAAAMEVAEDHDMVFPHHTGSLTYAYTYDRHFPMWANGLQVDVTMAEQVLDALESTGTPPKTIAFVINQFPGTLFTSRGQEGSRGAVQVARERGYDVVLDAEYPVGTTDFSALAAQVQEADPDFLYLAGIGVDANNMIAAMDELDYRPPGMFVQWPARGPLLDVGENVLSVTLFEPYEPFLSHTDAAEFNDAYTAAVTEAGFPYPVLDTIAAVSFASWQVLTAGVEGAGSLDQAAIADWLQNNTVETILGPMTFDPENQNYGPDLQKISQVRDGRWVVVYPPEFATEGYEVLYSPAPVEPEAAATEAKIANAMSAGPAVIAEGATIMDWPAGWPGDWPAEPGGELIELRPGSNGWTCLPDRPETPTNDPLCLNQEMLAWRKAIIDKTEPEPTGVGIAYMLQGGSSASTVDPFLLEPPAGEDWGSGPAHVMILPPGGEEDLTAFGTTPGPAPWVMNSGTPYAHLMVALPPIPEAVPAEDKVANAMSAGPAAITEEATIMDWPSGWPGDWPAEPGGELIELRPGTNGWTCLPDRPETPTNDPLCLNQEMLAWRQSIIDKTSPEPTGVGIAYMLQGGSSASTVDPFLLEPPAGEDWGSGPAHVMILTPGGEADLTAFGTTPGPAPWVMNSGTPYAHLMVALPAIPDAVALED